MNKLYISVKCSDQFMAFGNIDRSRIEYDGYVPEFFGGGDYLNLTINLDSMEIIEIGDCAVTGGRVFSLTKKEVINGLRSVGDNAVVS